MKWGIEHLKVTLRDDSGETVVIEQSKDGAVRCEQANGAPRRAEPAVSRRDPLTTPAAEPAAASRAASPRAEAEPRAKSQRRRRARSNEKKEGHEARSEATPQKPGSLDWQPTKDSNSWGVLARSGRGQFKVLRRATSVWSLFYERLDADGYRVANAELLACFPIDAEHTARAKAQALHDQGVYNQGPEETEPVYQMCPAPTPGSAEASRTRRVRNPKAPVETETPAQEVATEPAVDPAMDAAIMGGLDNVLKQFMTQANPQ